MLQVDKYEEEEPTGVFKDILDKLNEDMQRDKQKVNELKVKV